MTLKLPRFSVLARAAMFLVLASTPAAHGSEIPLELMELSALEKTDPAEALARIDAALADPAIRSDIRLAFDLSYAKAGYLRRSGDVVMAGRLLAQLAQLAGQQRDLLNKDVAGLWSDASDALAEGGEFVLAMAAAEALLDEQRDAGLSGEVLAKTMDRLAALALRAEAGSTISTPGKTSADWQAAAQAARAADNQPPTRGKTDGFREVEVYYATDRARSGDPDPADFYGSDRGPLELGVATVTIPDSHQRGAIDSPSILRLEFGPSPAKHMILKSVTPLAPDTYFSKMQHEFTGDNADREAIVFIHGYNVTFDAAAKRAAQLSYDMAFPGVPILYSWPSRGNAMGYVADSAVVNLSGRRLTRFLDDLVEKSGARVIHLVAHSMGNRALTDALELMALRQGVKDGDPPLFGQVIFAAPDVDAGLFAAMLPTIRPLARRLTLYASEQDWALIVSRKLHGGSPRAGQGGTDTLANGAIDSVDMSDLGEDMLAHSYFANDGSAIADMTSLIWQNAAPLRRCGVERVGPEVSQLPVYRYQPGECANQALVNVMAHLRQRNVRSVEQAMPIVRELVRDPVGVKQVEQALQRLLGR